MASTAEAPAYTPVHRTPAWLSDYDVRLMILSAGEWPNADKAMLWDMLVALDKLVDEKGVRV